MIPSALLLFFVNFRNRSCRAGSCYADISAGIKAHLAQHPYPHQGPAEAIWEEEHLWSNSFLKYPATPWGFRAQGFLWSHHGQTGADTVEVEGLLSWTPHELSQAL